MICLKQSLDFFLFFLIFSVFGHWKSLHTVPEMCGFHLNEVDKVVNVTVPYTECLNIKVWQLINSVSTVPEEITLLFLLLG